MTFARPNQSMFAITAVGGGSAISLSLCKLALAVRRSLLSLLPTIASARLR